jgi:antiviral helicase SKI2
LLRKPGAKGDFVRGRTGQFPFSPGGLDGVSEERDGAPYRINEKTQLGSLASIPPGFTRGLKIKSVAEDLELETTELDDEDDSAVVVRSVHFMKADGRQNGSGARTGFEEIDDLLPEEVGIPTV